MIRPAGYFGQQDLPSADCDARMELPSFAVRLLLFDKENRVTPAALKSTRMKIRVLILSGSLFNEKNNPSSLESLQHEGSVRHDFILFLLFEI